MKIKLFALFAVCFLLIPLQAKAQEPKGITVSPSIVHIDLGTDPAEYSLTYTNNTLATITLSLKVQDFTELEDNYGINFLNPKDASNFKYSLSSWISFENPSITLDPKESKTIKVFIDKNRITKGGHYASILAQVEQNPDQKQISLKAALSSLLFVRANTGQEIEEGKIVSFHPTRDGIDYPTTYILNFENSGNVFVTPYGVINVYDPLGNLVARGVLNVNSLDALPESIRRYDSQVKTFQQVLLPGFYTVELSMHFGKENKKLTTRTQFFSQGSFDFVKIGGVLVLIIVALLYLKRRKSS